MHQSCDLCKQIAENPKLTNVALGQLLGTSEASIRRHRGAIEGRLYKTSLRDPDTGSWYKYRYPALEPQWPVVQSAQPVSVTVSDLPAAPVRGDYKLSLKCSDPQIGFRRLSDGSFETFHDPAAMAVFVDVVRRQQPDNITILGDFLDLPSNSRYTQEAGFAQTTQMSLDAGYQFLAELRAAAPQATIDLIEGNHDARLQGYVERNALAAFGLKQASLPDSWPVMSLPNLLRLDELGVAYQDAYPNAVTWDNDYVRNIHGTKAKQNMSTTAEYSRDLPHISTFVGHSHRTEITYRTTLGPRGEAIESYTANPGCLCRTDGTVPGFNSSLHSDGTHAKAVENWQQGWGANLYNETESWPFVYRIKDGRSISDNFLRG